MKRNDTYKSILSRLQSCETYKQTRTGEESERHIIGLDSNENYFADLALIRKMALQAARCDLRSYPRGGVLELREMLGEWLQVDPESFVIANGGDQIIDLVSMVLLRDGTAITVAPTYSLYRLRPGVTFGRLVEVPLRDDFSLDANRLLSAAEEVDASVMFLCSPNNPTGNSYRAEDIEKIMAKYSGLVLLDEAYVEFADHSLVPLIRKYPNLGVIRTFSKAFGIAGARLGYLVAETQLSRILAEKAQLPYPVSNFSVQLGVLCMRHIEAMKKSVSRLARERRWLIDQLREIEGLQVFESETNFVLVCTSRDSSLVSTELRSQGISVKDVGDVCAFRGCLRITVGTRPMNEKMLSALKQVMSQ